MNKKDARILVVDDSDFSRKEISKYLEAANLNVVGEASSAKEATNFIKDRHVDIAIVDIVMPEISGLELTEFIVENNPDTAVICISSLAQENIVMEAISAGASDFIQKPIKQEQLLESIYKLLSNGFDNL